MKRSTTSSGSDFTTTHLLVRLRRHRCSVCPGRQRVALLAHAQDERPRPPERWGMSLEPDWQLRGVQHLSCGDEGRADEQSLGNRLECPAVDFDRTARRVAAHGATLAAPDARMKPVFHWCAVHPDAIRHGWIGAEGRVVDLADLQDRLDTEWPQDIPKGADSVFDLALGGMASHASRAIHDQPLPHNPKLIHAHIMPILERPSHAANRTDGQATQHHDTRAFGNVP